MCTCPLAALAVPRLLYGTSALRGGRYSPNLCLFTWRRLPQAMQGLFGCLPWGMLLTFLNDYLSQNKGLTVPTATAVRGQCPCSWQAVLSVLVVAR